jgi:hypothetical protein
MATRSRSPSRPTPRARHLDRPNPGLRHRWQSGDLSWRGEESRARREGHGHRVGERRVVVQGIPRPDGEAGGATWHQSADRVGGDRRRRPEVRPRKARSAVSYEEISSTSSRRDHSGFCGSGSPVDERLQRQAIALLQLIEIGHRVRSSKQVQHSHSGTGECSYPCNRALCCGPTARSLCCWARWPSSSRLCRTAARGSGDGLGLARSASLATLVFAIRCESVRPAGGGARFRREEQRAWRPRLVG